MTTYTLRQWRNEGQYYLVKWYDSLDGHKEPEGIYYMTANYCGCPSPRNPCKHQAIKREIVDFANEQGLPLWRVARGDSGLFILSDMLAEGLTL